MNSFTKSNKNIDWHDGYEEQAEEAGGYAADCIKIMEGIHNLLVLENDDQTKLSDEEKLNKKHLEKLNETCRLIYDSWNNFKSFFSFFFKQKKTNSNYYFT